MDILSFLKSSRSSSPRTPLVPIAEPFQPLPCESATVLQSSPLVAPLPPQSVSGRKRRTAPTEADQELVLKFRFLQNFSYDLIAKECFNGRLTKSTVARICRRFVDVNCDSKRFFEKRQHKKCGQKRKLSEEDEQFIYDIRESTRGSRLIDIQARFIEAKRAQDADYHYQPTLSTIARIIKEKIQEKIVKDKGEENDGRSAATEESSDEDEENEAGKENDRAVEAINL